MSRRTPGDVRTDLHKTIIEFIEDVRDNIFTRDSEYADLEVARWFIRGMDAPTLMERCREHILPWKKHITARDAAFFIKNKAIFQGLPEDKLEYFSALWKPGNTRLSPDNKEVMFVYFDTIVDLIEEHEKMK